MFNIDYNDIVDKIVPPVLQFDKLKSLAYVMVKPIQTLHSSFVIARNKVNYSLQFNAQVIYLERYLNDQYDPINRGISIEDTANVDYQYLYNKNENRPPRYLYNQSEVPPKIALIIKNVTELNSNVDYIVNVPIAVTFTEIIMRNQILKYNLAGKRFNINTF